MREKEKEGKGSRAGRSTARSGRRGRNALMLPLHRKALLKLQAARTIEQYWAAAQALTETAAPCSTRWFCVRPTQMAGALLFLRETSARGRSHPARKEDEAAQLKDLFARHPAMLYFRRNVRTALVHLNAESAGSRSEPSKDLLRERRWKYGVALAFWQRKRIEGLLLLHRSAREGDFSRAELASLRELHSHFETTLVRLIATRGQQAETATLASIIRPLPLPVVLCDSKLRIVCESADGLLARTGWELGVGRARAENPSSRRPLPKDLASFCRARLDTWEHAKPTQRLSLEKEECECEHAAVAHLRATVQMIRPKGFPLSRPLFLIRFESTAAASGELVRNGKFDALSRLSACERDLALLICEGHGNERIARELGKSLHTIKAQLSSVFGKLQVKSRSQLAARINRSLLFVAPWVLASVFDGLAAAGGAI